MAWRVHDAQYWGVPQRRRRIALVADFGGQTAEEILFESEGLSGYTPQGFRSWQGSAGAAEEGAHPSGVGSVTFVAVENHSADSRVTVSADGKVQTLTSRMGTGGNNVPLVMKIRCGCEGGGKGPLIQTDKSATLATNNDQTVFVPTVYGICAKDSNAMKSDNPNSGFYKADTTRTLDANGGNPSCNQGGMAVVALEGNGARPSHQGCGYSEEDVSFTLNATEQHGVAYGLDRAAYNQGENAKFAPCIESEVEPPMVARGPGAVAHPVYSTSKNSYHTQAEEDIVNTLVATDYKDPPTVTEEPYYIVRRLTPTECERLQGYPDGWTDIGEWTDSKGKKHKDADSPRYKALGNSIALPFWDWLLKRIAAECDEKTMVSLFDGIGGFPLCWQRAGGETLWVSEIEEFCIAVTEKRFGGG